MLTSESPDQDDRLKWVFATNDEFNIDIYKYRKIWVAGEVGTTGERREAIKCSTAKQLRCAFRYFVHCGRELLMHTTSICLSGLMSTLRPKYGEGYIRIASHLTSHHVRM